MARVYVTTDGADVRIGSHGNASRLPVKDKKGRVQYVETPAVVPDEVAVEFDGNPQFRVERDEPRKARRRKVKE